MSTRDEQFLLADCLRARAAATAAHLALQESQVRVTRTARLLADDALARARTRDARPVEIEYLAALEAELEAEQAYRAAERDAQAAELDYRNLVRLSRTSGPSGGQAAARVTVELERT